jgi:branched-chain amino acid transport system substrate-binding protein
MSQPSEPVQEEVAAPKPGRRKLIAIVVGIVIALVAVAAGAVYYLGLGHGCGTVAYAAEPSGSGVRSLTLESPSPPGPTNLGVKASAVGTITVGFSISLTGTYNVEGTNSLKGMNSVAEWINTHGGITVQGQVYNVSLKYYDDQSASGNIVQLYTKLINTDGAQFLIAPYSSGLTTAAAPIADQYDRIMLSHGGSADTIWTSTNRRNLVEVLSPASSYLKGAVDWIKANHPLDRIAAVYAGDSFSTLATQAAVAYAQSIGLNVVYNQSYPATATDLSTQLNAAKLVCADDLIGGGHFNDGLLIMNQLKTTWTPRFVSLLVAVTEPTFQTQLAATSNRVTGPSQWESRVTYNQSLATSKGLEWFGPTPAEFTTLYGTLNAGATPSYHAAEAGASLLVLADAIGKANTLNTTAVRAALGSMHIMDFFGEFQINSRGLQIAHSMVLVQWQAAALKIVQPQAIAESPVQYPYTGA